jgi:hypothetical protein
VAARSRGRGSRHPSRLTVEIEPPARRTGGTGATARGSRRAVAERTSRAGRR